MLKRTIGTGLAVLLVLTAAAPALALNHWLGTTANWHDADNWGDATVPSNSIDALLDIGPRTGSFDPNIGATDAACNSLKFEGGAHDWAISGTGTLSVYGDITAGVAGTQTIDCLFYMRDGGYPQVNPSSGTTVALTQGLNTSGVTGIVVDDTGTLKILAASTNPAFYELWKGTLMVTNTTGSATGSNFVSILSAATLTGNGIVGDGGNNVHNYGSIAPGLSIGTLSANVISVSFYNGSTLDIEIAGSSIDLLAIDGNLYLDNPAGGTYDNTLNVTGTGTGGTFITYTGSRVGEFANVDLPSGYYVDYSVAGQVNLVPEPATLALLGLGGLGLLVRRKR